MTMALPKVVTDFLTAQEQFNADLSTEQTGVADDVTELNRQIQELKDNPGEADQETIDRIAKLSTDGAALVERMKALNERTPPATPPTT